MSFLWKWLFCSWAHRRHRCYPYVLTQEAYESIGMEYKPEWWHCAKCHPCGEELDEILGERGA